MNRAGLNYEKRRRKRRWKSHLCVTRNTAVMLVMLST